jgi:hypothetical protein
MKVFLLSIFFLINIDQSFSQKCNYSVDKKDPFTGNILRSNGFNLEDHFGLYFERNGSEYFIYAVVLLNGELNFSMEEGAELNLKLVDGTVMTLLTKEKILPVSTASMNGVYTCFSMKYLCSVDQLEQIAKSGISFVQPKITSYNLLKELSTKQNKKTMSYARCIIMP